MWIYTLIVSVQFLCTDTNRIHIYISAWGSALLVQTTVGNAKASKRGTGNDQAPALFYMNVTEKKIPERQFGESAE